MLYSPIFPTGKDMHAVQCVPALTDISVTLYIGHNVVAFSIQLCLVNIPFKSCHCDSDLRPISVSINVHEVSESSALWYDCITRTQRFCALHNWFCNYLTHRTFTSLMCERNRHGRLIKPSKHDTL